MVKFIVGCREKVWYNIVGMVEHCHMQTECLILH